MKVFISPSVITPEGEGSLDISFGGILDAEALGSWEVRADHPNLIAARDSVEFARLAGKRWQYYLGRNEAAVSLEDLIKRSSGNQDETGFLLVGRLAKDKTILAMAWCRRTWCHHLVLDFLATHPDFDKRSGYQHIGTAMLLAIGLVTRRAKVPLVWGEATSGSAGFYKKSALQENKRRVQDHFFIRGKNLANLRKAAELFAV